MGDEVLGFTGHRPEKLGGFNQLNPWATAVRARMREVILEVKPTAIVSGFALGTDQWAAWLAIKEGIYLIAAVPHDGQELIWPRKSQLVYHQLLKQAQEVHVVSPGPYNPGKMFKRNEWMVERSTKMCAVWDGSDGGTAHCVGCARKQGLPIIRIDPREVMPRPRTS